MGFSVAPLPGDPGQPNVRLGRVGGAEAGAERRLLRDGSQVLAHGALICPSCALPVSVPGAVTASRELRCGYCDHATRATAFLREDVFDTPANEVYLVARVS